MIDSLINSEALTTIFNFVETFDDNLIKSSYSPSWLIGLFKERVFLSISKPVFSFKISANFFVVIAPNNFPVSPALASIF